MAEVTYDEAAKLVERGATRFLVGSKGSRALLGMTDPMGRYAWCPGYGDDPGRLLGVPVEFVDGSGLSAIFPTPADRQGFEPFDYTERN